MPAERVTIHHPVTKATTEVAASAVPQLKKSGWRPKAAPGSTAKPARKPRATDVAADAASTTETSSQPASALTDQ